MGEHKITFNDHIRAAEEAIDHIAFIRKMAEVDGHDMDKFDDEINKLCDKYHSKYAGMNEMQVALHGLAELLRSGHGDDIIDRLGEVFED